MFRRCAWGLVPVAIAVLSERAATAASGRADPAQATYHRFHGGPPTAPPVEKPRPRPAEAAKRPSETAAALRAQEEANLLRRLAVCDRLKQLALEQGDGHLEQEAIRLEERAMEVYRERTKGLGPKPAKSPDEGDRR